MTGLRKDGTAPVHRWVKFANPHLYCKQCGQAAPSWHDDSQCGTPHAPCPAGWYLAPCGHAAEAKSSCPTWGPVDQCQCLARLGRQDHATARR